MFIIEDIVSNIKGRRQKHYGCFSFSLLDVLALLLRCSSVSCCVSLCFPQARSCFAFDGISCKQSFSVSQYEK